MGEMYHVSKEGAVTPVISLRDWFAGQALVAVTLYADATEDHEFIAAQAYKMADAMLAERTTS